MRHRASGTRSRRDDGDPRQQAADRTDEHPYDPVEHRAHGSCLERHDIHSDRCATTLAFPRSVDRHRSFPGWGRPRRDFRLTNSPFSAHVRLLLRAVGITAGLAAPTRSRATSASRDECKRRRAILRRMSRPAPTRACTCSIRTSPIAAPAALYLPLIARSRCGKDVLGQSRAGASVRVGEGSGLQSGVAVIGAAVPSALAAGDRTLIPASCDGPIRWSRSLHRRQRHRRDRFGPARCAGARADVYRPKSGRPSPALIAASGPPPRCSC